MFQQTTFALTTLACLGLAATAQADGPPEDPQPLPPVVVAHDWSGAYAGLSLSANTGDFGNGGNFPGDGEGDLSGSGYGLLLGYNIQNGKWVYGAELALSGADINGHEDCSNTVYECGAKIDRFGSLRAKLGYTVGPQTLVFGLAGFAAADVYAYTDDDGVFGRGRNGETQRVNGYVFGLGLEHMVSKNVALRGAIIHHSFNDADYMTDVPYSDIDADFTSIEIGVTYQF
ncbi:outer membrane protein [Pacificoceanicola onchidii]|uniref:outer membrane protein n=1 Tax=Pacificoceanicola onchidii TaxID=2562685 RepID=UPI0010A2C148|nr:outer membrane beta-barrel protein [Pacificoceanicola onchidii]